MAKRNYEKIPAQFTRFNKEEPYSRPLRVFVELLEGTYQLLFHPVYDFWKEYDRIDSFKTSLHGKDKYHRTYFERTIFQARQWENFTIDGKTQWIECEGDEHAIEHVQFLWKKLNELYVKGEESDDSFFEGGVDFFRTASAGLIKGYAIGFAYTCNQMILTNRKNQYILENNLIPERPGKATHLQRLKSNLEHEKDQLDNIVFDGLMHWIDIELGFHKRVNEKDEVSAECRLIIESYLTEQKTRRGSLQLLQQLMDGQLDEFCNGLSELAMNAFSFLDFSENESERNYHAMIGGVFTSFSNEYKLSSN